MGDERGGGTERRRRGARVGIFAVLTAALVAAILADKGFGVLGAPRALVALAAVTGCLAALPAGRSGGWTAARAFVFVLLAAGFGAGWRFTADPTPLALWQQLRVGDRVFEASPEEALLLYREAERAAPENPHVLTRLAAAYYHLGDYRRAASAYEKALQEGRPPVPEGRRWRSLTNLGQSYWKLGRAAEAVEAYRAAEEAGLPAEERPLMDYRIASAYFDLRDFDRSIAYYRRVADADGEYAPAALYTIGCAYAQQYLAAAEAERPALRRRAVEHLRRAWETVEDPDDRQAFLTGLAGPPGERDPELDPVRETPEMERLIREVLAANDNAGYGP